MRQGLHSEYEDDSGSSENDFHSAEDLYRDLTTVEINYQIIDSNLKLKSHK